MVETYNTESPVSSHCPRTPNPGASKHRRKTMKTLVFFGVFAYSFIMLTGANAQITDRYCQLKPGGGSWDCRFATLEQCMASGNQGSGSGSNSCQLNPAFRKQGTEQ
jgi:hypothetical protein